MEAGSHSERSLTLPVAQPTTATYYLARLAKDQPLAVF